MLFRHGLRNALIPAATVAGIVFAEVVTGSFFVESITAVPGIGRYFVSSVMARDYPVIMGTTLLFAAVVMVMNLFVDILYTFLDPHASAMTERSVLEQRFAHRPRSLWSDSWRRLRRNRAALISIGFILFLFLVAIFAAFIAPYGYDEVDFGAITQPPSREHWLGTDSLGRDVLSRLIYGTRVSLTVAVVAQVVILLIGVPVGMVSGYLGGWTDLVIQRGVDILYAFPSLLFVIVLMTYLTAALKEAKGPVAGALGQLNDATGGMLGIFIALGLIFWLTVSRMVRGEVLSIRQKEYVEAARAIGSDNRAILWRHVFPNILAPVVIAATFGIPAAIMIEAGLSFLGLGVKPPTPSWGLMISEGVRNIRSHPHLLLASGILLSLTLLAFNFLGDGLRDAMDPNTSLVSGSAKSPLGSTFTILSTGGTDHAYVTQSRHPDRRHWSTPSPTCPCWWMGARSWRSRPGGPSLAKMP